MINGRVNRIYESVIRKEAPTMGMYLIVSKLDARKMNRRLPHKR